MSNNRTLDKFYTKPNVALHCISLYEEWANLSFADTDIPIIEPSAGNGAFLSHLPKKTLAYDLAPEHPSIKYQNFLFLKRKKRALVIGNPPFGKNSSLAVSFFNHSARFADWIGFIVPRTFEKTSLQNKLDLSFHLVNQYVLPKNSFLFNDKDYPVPCVFQLWEKRSIQRQKLNLPTTHPDFSFSQRDNAHLALQRIGVNAGAVKTSFQTVGKPSHYFISSNINPLILTQRLKTIDFSDVKCRTAGNPSISKTELVSLYTDLTLVS
jgi:hypothetical protein